MSRQPFVLPSLKQNKTHGGLSSTQIWDESHRKTNILHISTKKYELSLLSIFAAISMIMPVATDRYKKKKNKITSKWFYSLKQI